MKKLKRATTLILTLVIILSLLPVSSFAAFDEDNRSFGVGNLSEVEVTGNDDVSTTPEDDKTSADDEKDPPDNDETPVQADDNKVIIEEPEEITEDDEITEDEEAIESDCNCKCEYICKCEGECDYVCHCECTCEKEIRYLECGVCICFCESSDDETGDSECECECDCDFRRVIVYFNHEPAAVQVDEGNRRGRRISRRAAEDNVSGDHRSFRRDLDSLNRRDTTKREIEVIYEYRYAANGVAMSLTPEEIEYISGFSSVREIIPDFEVKAVPHDATLTSAASHSSMKVDELPATLKGDGVYIAILDSGIDYTHSAFQGAFPTITDMHARGATHITAADLLRINGNDYYVGRNWFTGTSENPVNNPSEANCACHPGISNHGTHVSGIAAGRNIAGVVGVAPNAKIFVYRMLCGTAGTGLSGTTVTALFDRLVIDKADVVNMSFGLWTQAPPNRDSPAQFASVLINNIMLHNPNMVFVGAAGNDGSLGNYSLTAPASSARVISVGNTSIFTSNSFTNNPINWSIAPSSSRGPLSDSFEIKPDVTAPGQQIRAAVPVNTYSTMSGTSMASPQVAGVAALMIQHSKPNQWNAEEIKCRIMNTAVATSGDQSPNNVGAGFINARAAIDTNTVVSVYYDRVATDSNRAFDSQLSYGTTKTGSFSFGHVGSALQPLSLLGSGHWQPSNIRTLRAEITNNSSAPITYNITHTFLNPPNNAAIITLSQRTITVPPNSSREFTATMSVGGSVAAGFYAGNIVVTGGNESISLPFMLVSQAATQVNASTLSFDLQGGSITLGSDSLSAIDPINVLHGVSILSVLNYRGIQNIVPVKTNYSFVGWSLSSSIYQPVTASPVMPASNTTLYAHFRSNLAPNATVENVRIGNSGPRNVVINLENATFENNLTYTGSWIPNLPAGLTQTAVRDTGSNTKVIINIDGIPEVVSTERIIIEIPADSLIPANPLVPITEPLIVVPNPLAVFNTTLTFNLATGTGTGVGAGLNWDGTVLTVQNGVDVIITGSVSNGRRIEVEANTSAKITLDDVSITGLANNQSPLLLNSGSDVNLTITKNNTLTAGANRAGIQVPLGTTLTIAETGNGVLTATGGNDGAGIGGGNNGHCGTITINSGTITATGGAGDFSGAGIGGGNRGNAGTITINGGTITATGGIWGAAGIGGGAYGSGGTISINGGNVTAIHGDGAFTGVAGNTAAGIGRGTHNNNNGTFTMRGNAFVLASGISDQNESRRSGGILVVDRHQTRWYGGNTFVASGAVIQNEWVLTIPSNKTLIIPANTTFTNNGAIYNLGTIDNNGRIENNGIITQTVNNYGSGTIGPNLPVTIVSGKNMNLSTTSDSTVGDGWLLMDNIFTILSSGAYEFTGSTGSPSNRRRIEIAGNLSVDITLNNVSITGLQNRETALRLNNGTNADVTILGNNNTLTSGANRAGIRVPQGSTLTITGSSTGTLTVGGSFGGAGIGGNIHENSGTITINRGIINATGSISSTNGGAGIGGGANGAGGIVTINGGVVTATGTAISSGIGSGSGNSTSGTLTMSGNAVVFASTVSDTNVSRRTGGLLFIDGSAGLFYGTTVTPTNSFTLPGGRTLAVPADRTLSISETVVFYLSGTVNNQGTVINNGTINITGTRTGNRFTPVVRILPTASSIYVGEPLSASALTGGTASVAGTFNWTNPATIPLTSGGNHSVTFTPTDSANYFSLQGEIPINLQPRPPLTGTATIDNTNPRINDLLTGSLVGGNNTGTLSYVWKAGGVQVGTSQSYMVGVVDLGKAITLEITSSRETGTLVSSATSAVQKRLPPSAPAAPAFQSKTHNTITLTPVATHEFRMGSSGVWQGSNVFTGLTPNTTYSFYQRIAETAVNLASDASLPLSVTTDPPPQLTGTATISNTNPRIGDTLNGSLAGGNNTGTLSYVWKAGGTQVGTSQSYTVGVVDLDKIITLEITSSVETGMLVSSATSAVQKKLPPAAPAAPTLVSKTNIQITLTSNALHEFRMGSSGVWQGSNVFTGLTPNTAYTFHQRIKETSDTEPSAASLPLSVTTDPNVLSGTATISNTIPRIGDTLNGSLTGGNNTGTLSYVWKAGGVQVGTSQSYTVGAADLGKAITLEITSSVETGMLVSSATSAVQKRLPLAAPAAPALQSRTHDTITLTPVATHEFRMGSSGGWQESNVFTGLTPNTTYAFYQRIAETADRLASDASLPLSVTTDHPLITGTAKIDNTTPVIGDVLTGSYIPGNNTGTLSYTWKAGTQEVGTGINYTVKTTDAGRVITLEIRSTIQSGMLTSAPTSVVLKLPGPAAPEAPTLQSKTFNTITLAPNALHEFRINNGAWQRSNVFSRLQPDTEYIFHQRIAETAERFPSAASGQLIETTEPIIVIVIPTRLTISPGYNTITPGQPLTLTLSAEPAGVNLSTITWNYDKSVFTSSINNATSSITLTANNGTSGNYHVRAGITVNGTQYTTSSVISIAPPDIPVTSDRLSARLLERTVELNIHRKHGALLPVSFTNLSNNRSFTLTSTMAEGLPVKLYANYGRDTQAIHPQLKARIAGDTRFIEVIWDENIPLPARGLNINSLTVVIGDGIVAENTVNVRVTMNLPTVKFATSGNLNTRLPEQSITKTATSPTGEVKIRSVNHPDLRVVGDTGNNSVELRLNNSAAAGSIKPTVTVQFENYKGVAEYQSFTPVVRVVSTNPSLRLSANRIVMLGGSTEPVEIILRSGNARVPFESGYTIERVEATGNNRGLISNIQYISEPDNNFGIIRITPNSNMATQAEMPVPLRIHFAGGHFVELAFRVQIVNERALRFSSPVRTAFLNAKNTNADAVAARIPILINNGSALGVSYDDWSIRSVNSSVFGAVDLWNANVPIRLESLENEVVIRANPAAVDAILTALSPTGSNVNFTIRIGSDEVLAGASTTAELNNSTLALTITLTRGTPSFRIQTSGRINIVDPESFITGRLVLTNISSRIDKVELLTESGGSLSQDFEATVTGLDTFEIRAIRDVTPRVRHILAVRITLENGSVLDSRETGNSRGRIQITPVQTVFRAIRTPAQITLFTDRPGMMEDVNIRLNAPADVRIGAARIVQPADFQTSGFEIIRGGENVFHIGFKDGIAPVRPLSNQGEPQPLPAFYNVRVEIWTEGTYTIGANGEPEGLRNPGNGNIMSRPSIVTVRVNIR